MTGLTGGDRTARHRKRRCARQSSSSASSGAFAFCDLTVVRIDIDIDNLPRPPNSFTELCATAPTVLALQYLQNDLADVVDHSSPAESASFRACMSSLLAAPARMNVEVALDGSGELPPRSPSSSASSSSEHHSGSDMPDAELYAQRHALWEELVRFFPREERQPDARLEDTSRLLRVWESSGRRL